jgi:hypothetical protein
MMGICSSRFDVGTTKTGGVYMGEVICRFAETQRSIYYVEKLSRYYGSNDAIELEELIFLINQDLRFRDFSLFL